MGSGKKKDRTKEEQDEKYRNWSNRGKTIGQWTESQMQAAFDCRVPSYHAAVSSNKDLP